MSNRSVDELLATANALVTDPISDAEAAFICQHWHSGQWTDMYGYQSSGELTNPAGIAAEARSAYEHGGHLHDGGHDLLALYQWACKRSAEREAFGLGAQAGAAAGSWAADGNTSPEHARRVLAMLADGDPAADDYLPARPDLSGEWADDHTPLSLAREITGDDEPGPSVIDALSDAWERGVDSTFIQTCERELRAYAEVQS